MKPARFNSLRDIFIAWLRNAHIQRELLEKDNALSFVVTCTITKKEATSKEVFKLTSTRADTHVKPLRRAGCLPPRPLKHGCHSNDPHNTKKQQKARLFVALSTGPTPANIALPRVDIAPKKVILNRVASHAWATSTRTPTLTSHPPIGNFIQ